ncbi:ABC transporter ATP-binding protein NatA [Deinococcus carri]|uniref:ABC transporter ATP-binding protein NatA n=1 Tax=Deinococcus carri TaxID=1211323 RepID=A0ABP9W276_9DEIO
MTHADGFPLCLSGLRVAVGGREVVRVETLEARPGELLHLRGKNGAGKTTLLRALVGVLPYTGRARVQGHPPGSVGARQATAFVPTDADLPDDLTVAEGLTFLAAAWRVPEAPLLALAEHFGLGAWLDAWPMTLSRGTRQKVALALGLGLGLPLTLLDEPFATLDTASRDVLREAIAQRCAEGGAVIVTTHGQELDALPQRVLELEGGVLHVPSAGEAA